MKKLFCIFSLCLLTLMAVFLPNFNNAKIYADNVEIQIVNQQSKYTLTDNLQIELQAVLPGDATNVAWKILKPNQTTFNTPLVSSNIKKEGLTAKYKFVPSKENCVLEGTYAIVVKYKTNDGDKYTNVKFIDIELEKIQDFSNLKINEFVVKNSKSNLQAYKFTIQGLDNAYFNTNEIVWYVGFDRYASGESFVFEPPCAGKYTIRAEVNNKLIDSIEVKSVVVNPKLQIILVSSFVGILLISLIIGIIINRKSEKIW